VSRALIKLMNKTEKHCSCELPRRHKLRRHKLRRHRLGTLAYEQICQVVISGFRRDVDEICLLMGYNAALKGNSLPTFGDNISVPSSRVKTTS